MYSKKQALICIRKNNIYILLIIKLHIFDLDYARISLLPGVVKKLSYVTETDSLNYESCMV